MFLFSKIFLALVVLFSPPSIGTPLSAPFNYNIAVPCIPPHFDFLTEGSSAFPPLS